VVSGFVKLDACTGTVTATADSDVTHLKKKGILIFWGDSNDVGKNNSQNCFSHLVNFMNKNRHINIISLCAPHRHDLVNWLCVNSDVRNFNMTQVKLRISQLVTVVRIDLNRKFFK